MTAIIKLAWLEFILPFKKFKSDVPGGRDFIWLTMMLTLVITLALLLLATRTGLINKFVDVFLGNTKDKGVPVWVIPNPFNRSGLDFINREIMDEIKSKGYSIYPYREIEQGLDYIELPEKSVWKSKSKLEPDFSGWAVYSDDPLYKVAKTASEFPLEISLSKSLFGKHFDFKAYKNSLRGQIPNSKLNKLPERFDENNLLKVFWLRIRVGDSLDLLPFDVTWLNRIPTISKIAFLFPMGTYHAIREAQNYPELHYFPEHNGKSGKRIKKILINSPVNQSKLLGFLKSNGAIYSKLRGKSVLTFRNAMPVATIRGILNEMGITYKILESVVGHRIQGSKFAIKIPCSVVPETELRTLSKSGAIGSNCTASKNITSAGNGYLRALVYVPDRTKITEAANYLLMVRNQALSIHPVYQDALNRFGFLTKILQTLRAPFATILIAFVIAILAIQISTLVDHRKIRYAIFMTKGLAWHHIYAIVYLQMLLSICTASVAAIVIIKITSGVVSGRVTLVADEFSHLLDLLEFNLLPLQLGDYVGVIMSVIIFAIIFASVILYTTPIRRRTHLALLLKS